MAPINSTDLADPVANLIDSGFSERNKKHTDLKNQTIFNLGDRQNIESNQRGPVSGEPRITKICKRTEEKLFCKNNEIKFLI